MCNETKLNVSNSIASIMQIRICDRSDYDQVVQLALDAWKPVFCSLEELLSIRIFQKLYPLGWAEEQEKAVLGAIDSLRTWVAVIEEEIVGFVTVAIHSSKGYGEIFMLAVDPSWQGRGVGAELTRIALTWMKSEEVDMVMVETGGDPAHLPARLLYESAGFRKLPIYRYYKTLR